jgi:hypothetical protein
MPIFNPGVVMNSQDFTPVWATNESITIQENTTTVATLSATNNPSFSIVGGDDQSKFQISNGVLEFITAPDFENPTDTGSNNTYVVDVRATNTYGFADRTITITISDVNENKIIINGTSYSNTGDFGTSAVTYNNFEVTMSSGTIFRAGGYRSTLNNTDIANGQPFIRNQRNVGTNLTITSQGNPTISVYMWGGGGGGGDAHGGGAGWVHADITLDDTKTYYLRVGNGGVEAHQPDNNVDNSISGDGGWGGGGAGGAGSDGGNGSSFAAGGSGRNFSSPDQQLAGGGGGGGTFFFETSLSQSNILLAAGAGGGGGGHDFSSNVDPEGGVGGGNTGGSALADGSTGNVGATGGTQNAGGTSTGGNANSTGNSGAGGRGGGGAGTGSGITVAGGGGGGSGYYGGGGGAVQFVGTEFGYGGGGGSSFGKTTLNYVNGFSTLASNAGSSTAPAGSPSYRPSSNTGSGSTSNGFPGAVVIRYEQ